MPMPKGHRVKSGYFTVADLPGAADFKQIAKRCNEMGYKMEQSTARNLLIRAMMKVADKIKRSQGVFATDAELYEMARSPTFQSGLADMLNER